MLKIKNLLVLILLNSFVMGPIVAAEKPLPPISVDAEEAPGFAGGGAGAAAGGSMDGAPAAIAEQGVLAKIELLRGTLTKAPTVMQGASLLHGAMLWELGIIKSLYKILVTPETVPYKDSTRLVPASSQWPLGNILMEFFYLAGGTFQPTHSSLASAKYLKPDFLGALYAATVQGQLVSDDFWPVTKRHYVKEWERLSISLKKLQQSFFKCNEARDQIFNPKNLLPSIIMAFFWAKFVMGIGIEKGLAFEQAFKNITVFHKAAYKNIFHDDVEKVNDLCLSPAQSIDDVEALVINRIKDLYNANIPKPPVSRHVFFLSKSREKEKQSFSDCGENGIRSLLLAAFYDKKNQRFVLPETVAYDPEVKFFFEKYSSLSLQYDQETCNAWARVCSGRPNILYVSCSDLACSFENLMSLLGSFVQSAIPTDCACLDIIDSLETGRAIHLNPCAEKILQNFAEMHGLEVTDFSSTDGEVTWKIKKTNAEPSLNNTFLIFNTHPGHMNCELFSTGNFERVFEPILGGCDAIEKVPEDAALIQPLVFAASRATQNFFYFDGYLSLYPFVEQNDLNTLLVNFYAWHGREPPPVLFSANRVFVLSSANRLWYTAKFALDVLGADVNAVEYGTGIGYAAFFGDLKAVRLFLSYGANINKENRMKRTPLILASMHGHEHIVSVLIENSCSLNLQDILGGTALHYAASRGHLAIVRLLLDANAETTIVNKKQKMALDLAKEGLHEEVVSLLEENAAMKIRSFD